MGITVQDLRQAYLFQGVSDDELERIAAAAEERFFDLGECIYRQGEQGTTLYLIVAGKVELLVEKMGETAHVAGHISAGGHFGEVSLFTGKPRSLTVRALVRTRVLIFGREQFNTNFLANPLIHLNLDRTLAERLSLASDGWVESGRQKTTTIAAAASQISTRGEGKADERQEEEQEARVEFELARKIRKKIRQFAEARGPVLINGESGTGRRLIAKQIHQHGARKMNPYVELDIRQFDSWIWEEKLFGQRSDSFPYAAGRQLGILDQIKNGTVVLFHAEELGREIQQKLSAFFCPVDSTTPGKRDLPANAPLLIVITEDDLPALLKESLFIPDFADMFADRVFFLPPLRQHKQDIRTLIDYYLQRYSAEYGKKVTKISADALNLLMKYDWPGNLTELSNVIHRAVMISPSEEILSEQIFLGLAGQERKLSYNLLRLPKVREIFAGSMLPLLGKSMAALFGAIIIALFLGPGEAEKNFGITLCWYIGWPLLIISFFFLPRFWCSICALSAPGKLVQRFVRPVRRIPAFFSENSGWIMGLFCIFVFWLEIVFNAYDNPRLTGIILLAIASGALLFSLFFERYTWCRYICPLGALNAIFSMPSILELRANRQMCINQCRDHVCYKGTDRLSGCPMYRHPFLVDNNKDCILCGKCIRNCQLRSIELNLRLAPSELWSLRSARLADNFLIVALGAVCFFLAYHATFLSFTGDLFKTGPLVGGSMVFWGVIGAAWGGYLLFSLLQAFAAAENYRQIRLFFGYGLIPMVLAGYLAYYTRMFVNEAWRILPNFFLLFGVETGFREFHLLTAGGTATLLHVIIFGGLLSSLYATFKIFQRLAGDRLSARHLALPFLCIILLGWAYLAAV